MRIIQATRVAAPTRHNAHDAPLTKKQRLAKVAFLDNLAMAPLATCGIYRRLRQQAARVFVVDSLCTADASRRRRVSSFGAGSVSRGNLVKRELRSQEIARVTHAAATPLNQLLTVLVLEALQPDDPAVQPASAPATSPASASATIVLSSASLPIAANPNANPPSSAHHRALLTHHLASAGRFFGRCI